MRNFHFDFVIDQQYTPHFFSMQLPVGFSEDLMREADRRAPASNFHLTN
jgi:hypothetical protein